MPLRPPRLRRTWLFTGGADRTMQLGAGQSGADVVILELEDFTRPAQRPAARALAAGLFPAWRAAGAVAAVRVNPLSGDGMDDLRAVLPAGPDVIMLPKVDGPERIRELAEAVDGIAGTRAEVELVPNVELARGLMRTYDVALSDPRVTACLVASEDMAADLGAERGHDGMELLYVRQRFHVECRAAGVVSIDCPYTYTDLAGLEAETRHARRLGYTAKSLVRADHVDPIHRILTPAPEALAQARRIVEAFDKAETAHVELDGIMLELPMISNARRLLDRAAEFEAWAAR
ncbi:MAG: CoA ester lyase [Alphaproteobacteria bacterium]|nr:CoA ester lyase [Alphaproteobacteria bacterium]